MTTGRLIILASCIGLLVGAGQALGPWGLLGVSVLVLLIGIAVRDQDDQLVLDTRRDLMADLDRALARRGADVAAEAQDFLNQQRRLGGPSGG
ncbi:hypothetical protein PAI11_37820 [Patulibacter medicamentivorans]|uniref:Uncharacterized protein n=1 Tax=Patulibacter medicamentivorans TaxID=1097667 RepID=H0EAA8_9ACTN|nr:hypothetical protein [Patulibacter medicamentivorans]EHN09448.1 hypothetical protein PAI11_37820 [Patulibacter medicamentivorans]